MDLTNYIKEQLKAGYDIGTLRNALLQYGYSEKDINKAIHNAYGLQEIKHVIHFSKESFGVMIGGISTAILITGIILFLTMGKGSELLDLSITLDEEEVKAGSYVSFSVEAFSMGGRKTFDVELKYEVFDSNGNLYGTKEETIALQTKFSTSAKINLPKNAPAGSYLLKAAASYGDKTAKASSSFLVSAYGEGCRPECSGKECGSDGCGGSCGECSADEECEDFRCIAAKPGCVPGCSGKECGSDGCGGSCGECPPGLDCVGGKCASGSPEPDDSRTDEEKTLDEIKEMSKADFGKAVSECKKLETTAAKDLCNLEISIAANDKGSCQEIINDMQRDQCFMNWALNNENYEICDKLTNANLKDSCELLKG